MATVDEIVTLFERQGDSEYGGEEVTQLEHALQAALLAEQEDAGPALIAAALLHDVGHLLHDLPDDAPDEGIDDCHEKSASHYLNQIFPPEVTEPIRLHVAAKRYLCAVEPEYLQQLSVPSVTSLNLQGGPMSDGEVRSFRENRFCAAAVRLRRWDDTAKEPDLVTPSLEHFRRYLDLAVTEASRRS